MLQSASQVRPGNRALFLLQNRALDGELLGTFHDGCDDGAAREVTAGKIIVPSASVSYLQEAIGLCFAVMRLDDFLEKDVAGFG